MQSVALYLQSILAYERVDEVDSWFLVRTPIPMLTIVLAYLCFVLKLGPQWMASRKPFNLQSALIIYNFIALLTNTKMILNVLRSDLTSYFVTNGCIKHIPLPIRLQACEFGWQILILKMFELFDTVFFVLRKKQNQVTILHVFHHSMVVFWTWMYLHYFPVPIGIPGAMLNNCVHVVMYFYYMMAAMGPQYQKYLWWKKYMTRVQIIQFVILMACYIYLYAYDCGIPNVAIVPLCTILTLLLILFTNFYIQCYRRNGKKCHGA